MKSGLLGAVPLACLAMLLSQSAPHARVQGANRGDDDEPKIELQVAGTWEAQARGASGTLRIRAEVKGLEPFLAHLEGNASVRELKLRR